MHHKCVIIADAPAALVGLCGISMIERLLRTLQRCQITRVTVISGTPELIREHLSQPSWPRAELDLTVVGRPAGPINVEQIVDLWPEDARFLLVVPADSVFDPRLLQALASQETPAALVDSAIPARLQALTNSAPDTIRGKLCGPALISRDWVATQTGSLQDALRNGLESQTVATLDVATQPLYFGSIRRNLRPFWFPAPSPSNSRLAKRVFLDSVQKGTLDIPAYVHGPIETFLVSHLCKTSITPNQLTVFTNVVAWVTTILFVTGRLGWGIALALIVGVLDGLDGKQARVKVETTKGGKLEHWFDAFFEWSWWVALAYYFHISGQLAGAFGYLALLLAAEAIDGILKGRVYFTTGQVIDELGPFERMIRLVGGRRNVYVWILAVAFILGAPATGFVVMAWLETATVAAHLPRAIWTLSRRRNVSAG
jgi:phosphatidylglycerophosphate synthase